MYQLFSFFNAERKQGGKTVLNVGNNIEFETETNLTPSALNGKYPGITFHQERDAGNQILSIENLSAVT